MNNETYYTLCPKCGKLITVGLKFCPHCAEKFVQEGSQKLVCPQCGKEAPKGEKFCSNCGVAYQVKEEKASAVHQGATAPQKEAPPQGTPRMDATLDGKMTRLEFYNAHASVVTKRLAMIMPIMCFLSCALMVIVAIIFAAGGLLGPLFLSLLFAAAMGTIAYFMLKRKSVILYAAETAILTTIFISTIMTTGFDASLILTAACVILGVYACYRLWKVEKAYEAYLRTGAVPEGGI